MRISISHLCRNRSRSGNVFFPNTSSRASREKPCTLRNPGVCWRERNRRRATGARLHALRLERIRLQYAYAKD